MSISNDIFYVGVNDYDLDLFEGQYPIPNGMAYNSYAVVDEKIAIVDSVEARFADEWLGKIGSALNGRSPDYLIVQHMEPDHSGSLLRFFDAFPDAVLVASQRAFGMIRNFFGVDLAPKGIAVKDGDTLRLGRHELAFYTAPMVHWPEVIVTYDKADKVLFSADAFGKFGARDTDEPWEDEARRYYFGIVGKYGGPTQTLLKKLAPLEIRAICSLHGPALLDHIPRYLQLYHTWSSYEPEEEGVVIAYTSIYGNTQRAVELLAERLKSDGCTVVVYDLARCDQFQAVADAFRYSRLVLATTTYNGGIFPFMQTFIHHLTERGYTNRTVAMIENGSWAPAAIRVMRGLLEKSKDLRYTENNVTILSALNETSTAQLEAMAAELSRAQSKAAEEELSTQDAAPLRKFVCQVCGYIYEGASLPPDFTCPLCGRGTEDFKEA